MISKEMRNWLPLVLGAAYLFILYYFIGWMNFNLVLVILVLLGWYLHKKSRKFILGMLPMIIYVILYDSMRAVPNHTFQEVDTHRVYGLEKKWFGIETPAGRVTPNEYFRNNTAPWLDVLGGIFYGNWFNFPLLLAIYFFLNKKNGCSNLELRSCS